MGLFSRKRSDPVEDDDVEVTDVDDGEEAVDEDAGPELDDVDATDAPGHGGDADSEVDAADAPGDDDDADADAEDELEGEDAEDEGEGEPTGYISFELADFGPRERQMLDAELASVRVRRVWEGSTLVVAGSDADVVDDLIDIIEERVALDLSPDVEPVTYEVGDWPDGLEDRFVEALIEARIAHMQGYREITVGVEDEERVDALVEKVTEAWEQEQPDEDELDGPDAPHVLSELFIGSDRLLHDPSDRVGTVRFDDAAEAATTMRVPFGFDEAAWTEIVDLVTALRDLLSDAEAADDDIVEAATALRTHLRPMV